MKTGEVLARARRRLRVMVDHLPGSRRTQFASLGAALVILSFGLFVWPTAYRLTSLKAGNNVYPVRIHRITGRAQRLTLYGWNTIEPTPAKPETKELPLEERLKLQSTAWLTSSTGDGYLKCTTYNGSTWHLDEITVELRAWDAGRENVDGFVPDEAVGRRRTYRLSPDGFGGIGPLEDGDFSTRASFKVGQGEKWSYSIVTAKGWKD